MVNQTRIASKLKLAHRDALGYGTHTLVNVPIVEQTPTQQDFPLVQVHIKNP